MRDLLIAPELDDLLAAVSNHFSNLSLAISRFLRYLQQYMSAQRAASNMRPPQNVVP
ncbi:hypothetical protein SCHPADRAFT_924830 [Schizopora paradoxa]|uniref:Uncharacterized protein n=1 Tax=Schizopora paradoxa TaxID=27342 RepID=A0A0H2S415_9AGAM|nr:hypothetical protein SCHPADRAFT_924830 [Schizopora paradoxa]